MGLTNWFTSSSSTHSAAATDARTCTAEDQRDSSSALPAPRPSAVTALAHQPDGASSKAQRASTVSLAPSTASTGTTLSDERPYDHPPSHHTASLPLEPALAMNDHDKEAAHSTPEAPAVSKNASEPAEPTLSSTPAWFGLWGSSTASPNAATTDTPRPPVSQPSARHAEQPSLSMTKTEALASFQSPEGTSPRRSPDSPIGSAARPRTQTTTSATSGTNSNRSSGLFAYFWPDRADHDTQPIAPLPSQPTVRGSHSSPGCRADVAEANLLLALPQVSHRSLTDASVNVPAHTEGPMPTNHPDALAQALPSVSSPDRDPSTTLSQPPPIIVYPASPTAMAPKPQVLDEATLARSTDAPTAQSEPSANPLLATLPATNSVWRYLFSRPQTLGSSAPRALLTAPSSPSPDTATTNATAAQPIAILPTSTLHLAARQSEDALAIKAAPGQSRAEPLDHDTSSRSLPDTLLVKRTPSPSSLPSHGSGASLSPKAPDRSPVTARHMVNLSTSAAPLAPAAAEAGIDASALQATAGKVLEKPEPTVGVEKAHGTSTSSAATVPRHTVRHTSSLFSLLRRSTVSAEPSSNGPLPTSAPPVAPSPSESPTPSTPDLKPMGPRPLGSDHSTLPALANGGNGDTGGPVLPSTRPGRPASVYSTISQTSKPSRKLARQATPRKGTQAILTQTTSPSTMVSTTTVDAVATGSAAAAIPTELTISKVNYVFPTADHMTAVVHAQRLQWNHHLQQQAAAMAPPSSHHAIFNEAGIRQRSQSLWHSVVRTVAPYVGSWMPALAHRLDHHFAEPTSQSCPPSLLERPSTESVTQNSKMADLMSQPSDWERPMKNVVIIGVHGWFPMKVVSRILGEPTGTSPKFCEMMYESLLTYLQQRSQRQAQTCSVCGHFTNLAALAESQRTAMTEGLDIDPNYYGDSDQDNDGDGDSGASPSVRNSSEHVPSLVDELESVSLIPLVGEGKIEDRVEMLWQQLVESDMAFQQDAMRTIPLVRRAWHQDSASDMVWLPATVRTQIQVTKKSREHRPSASKRRPTRAATENGRRLHKPSQDLATAPDRAATTHAVHHTATALSPTLLASKSALESHSSDHGHDGSTPAPSVREMPSSLPAAQAEFIGKASMAAGTHHSAATPAHATHHQSTKRKRGNHLPQPPRRYICPRCLRGHISTGAISNHTDSPAAAASTRARKGSSKPHVPKLSAMPWLPALYQADTVFIATHSQGTPVSTLLLDRLIRQGLVDPRRQRVGMLAMAGICHGPFPHLKDNVVVKYFEAEAARELFAFTDPSSSLSLKFQHAMDRVLNHGAKVVTVGSMLDQVVPLYSSIVHGLSHMNMYRAIYIDGEHYGDDFLTDLLIFALRLRNHGLRDHDLVVHLSDVIAGSLYTGTQGHSTIYNDHKVYELAAQWVMESIPSNQLVNATTSLGYFHEWAAKRHHQQQQQQPPRHLVGTTTGAGVPLASPRSSLVDQAPPNNDGQTNTSLPIPSRVLAQLDQPPLAPLPPSSPPLLTATRPGQSPVISMPSQAPASGATLPSTTAATSPTNSDSPAVAPSASTTASLPQPPPPPSTPTGPPLSFYPISVDSRTNPYFLPWVMRGIFEDPHILQHPEFSHEVRKLRDKFLQWNPTQKHLRDLKFRLEPLRANL
ncbi:hypothetical protein H4R35_001965 [Dimargaris xerosporica]|nr:hypothetical protein H4R35_001965 [Dimargaris xerosporica]